MKEIAEEQTLFKQQDITYIATFVLTTLDRNLEKY